MSEFDRITIDRVESPLNYEIRNTRTGNLITSANWLNLNGCRQFAIQDSMELSAGYDNGKIRVETTEGPGCEIHL